MNHEQLEAARHDLDALMQQICDHGPKDAAVVVWAWIAAQGFCEEATASPGADRDVLIALKLATEPFTADDGRIGLRVRSNEQAADRVLAAGFHRTVQGEPSFTAALPDRAAPEGCTGFEPQSEPSDVQVVAALNVYWAYDPPIVDPAYWSEKHKGIMRAALRAAAETGGEHRG